MTDTMNNGGSDLQPPSKMKSAMNMGAILGLVLMILSLVTYIFEMYESKAFGYLSWVVLAIGIVLGTKKYRDEALGGFISYAGALGYGVLISLFASIIVSIANYIYLGYIDSSFIDFTLEQTEIQMIEQGQPDEAIEMGMSWTRAIVSPMGIFFMGIIGTTFLGLIISLITSAFLKNDPDSFENS
jgi:hypothetical protein